MKPFERIPFLANVLIVACSRPNAEVGKLVKAVVTYVTEGTRTDLDDLRLQAYYDLLLHDIDSMRTAAEVKARNVARVPSAELQGLPVHLPFLRRKRMQRTQVQVNPKRLLKLP